MIAHTHHRQVVAQTAFGAFLIFSLFQANARRGEASPDAAALSALVRLQSAQTMFAASCGNGGYAASIDEPTQAPPGSSDRGFLPPDALQETNYRFTLRPKPGAPAGPTSCLGQPSQTDYYASAEPLAFGISGRASFATDSANVVWRINGPTAPVPPWEHATAIR
jgi:hypothetical protein